MKTNYCLALTSAFLVFSSVTSLQAVTLTAGDIDNGASPFDAADDAQPRPQFANWLFWETNNRILHSNQALEFDIAASNQAFGHTFNVPVGTIDLSQPVLFTVKFFGGFETNDVIGFQVFDGPESASDTPTFPTTGYDNFVPGFHSTHGTAGSSVLSAPITVDLRSINAAIGPLAGQDIASTVNNLGYLDVRIADDTGIDYLQLSFTAIPEPNASMLIALGLVTLRRRIR